MFHRAIQYLSVMSVKKVRVTKVKHNQIHHEGAATLEKIVTCLTIDSEIPDAAEQGDGKQRLRPSMQRVVGGWVCHSAHLKRLTYVQKMGSLRESRGHSAGVIVGRTIQEGGGGDVRVVESLSGWFQLVIDAAATAQVHNHLYFLRERMLGGASNNTFLLHRNAGS